MRVLKLLIPGEEILLANPTVNKKADFCDNRQFESGDH